MAWIKMRTDLLDDPAVIGMASRLCHADVTDLSRSCHGSVTVVSRSCHAAPLIAGCLLRVWSWAVTHTTDGRAEHVTSTWLDEFVGIDGFSAAMAAVGWLEIGDNYLQIPHFDRHLSPSAKERALGAARQASRRSHADVTVASRSCHGSVTDLSRAHRDKSVTRLDKRRVKNRRDASASLQPGAANAASGPDASGGLIGNPKYGIVFNPSIGSFAGITDADRAAWAEAYPACHVGRQIAAAAQWAMSNPAKRKKNWRRFLTGWLSRSQERGGDVPARRPDSDSPTPAGEATPSPELAARRAARAAEIQRISDERLGIVSHRPLEISGELS